MRRPIGLSAALALVACGESTLDKAAELIDYRVLAVQASPPQVAPEASVALRVFDFDPADPTEGTPPRRPYVWALCPVSLGALANYRCIDPGVEVVLQTDGPALTFDLGPEGPLAPLGFEGLVNGARCLLLPDDDSPTCTAARAAAPPEVVAQLARLDPALKAEAAAQLDLDAGVDLQVRVLSGVPDGPTRTAVKRVRVVRGADAANPRLEPLTVSAERVGDTLVATLSAHVAPALDAQAGLISWYAEAGTLEFGRTAGDQLGNELKVAIDALPTRVAVVARDGEGGVDARFVTITAP